MCAEEGKSVLMEPLRSGEGGISYFIFKDKAHFGILETFNSPCLVFESLTFNEGSSFGRIVTPRVDNVRGVQNGF